MIFASTWNGMSLTSAIREDFVKGKAWTILTPDELRQLRTDLGWSQARLAQELGFHKDTISKWECGLPGHPIPLVVAKYLRLLTD